MTVMFYSVPDTVLKLIRAMHTLAFMPNLKG